MQVSPSFEALPAPQGLQIVAKAADIYPAKHVLQVVVDPDRVVGPKADPAKLSTGKS